MRLYGKRPVLERLKAAPETIQTLTLRQGVELSGIVRAAKAAARHFSSLPPSKFDKLVGDVHSQGVFAEVEEFHYHCLDQLLEKREPRPVLLFLDRLTDPQNLGAILRTMACLGGIAVVLPQHESVEVNETVLRVASGGENYVPVARVTNLVQASERAKKAGYWIVGAAPSGGTPLPHVKWPFPLAVVLGSEGGGIRPGLQKHLELTVSLPMPGATLSFNVATAAALIAYEMTRARTPAAYG
jgi:23S rRNA (guanosine2251-2'-O)-methyltransferase